MLGLGTSILPSSSAFSIEAFALSNFKLRVERDGGSTDSPSCLTSAFDKLDDDFLDRNIVRDFGLRVARDGGSFEANNCALTEVTTLTTPHSLAQEILNRFDSRVRRDGGSFESSNCARTEIEALV
jgi:hypothetical protein